ncbi:MAG TPA: APC family permease [Candidatus Acidoferrales bacterium]|nr:APC family permease [Candidatus Acidoferrales bacterium]
MSSIFARTASGLTRDISATDALLFTVCAMAPATSYLYGIWSAAFYPGVDNTVAVLIAIAITIIIGVFYALFASAMPRTGGDYVWASRILHPAIGFSLVFFVVFILIAWTGTGNVFTITYSIGPLLTYYGFTGAASFLSSNTGMLIVIIIILSIWTSITAAGTKSFVKAIWACMVIQTIGALVYISTLLSLGHDGFVANFNALSGMNYNNILGAATTAGYPTGFLWSGTALGVVYMLLSFTGFNLAVYIAGEIKAVRRSSMIAIVGGTLLFGFWLYVIYAVTYSVMGAQFVNDMSYLSINGNPAYVPTYGASTPAFYNLLFIYAARGNPWLVGIVNLGEWVMIVCNLTYVFTCVRLVFAWSFDRILPKSFSALDRRFNAPYVALAVVAIACFISSILWLYTPFMSDFAYIVPGWFTEIGIVAIAGMIFSLRRKDIFDKSPPIVTKRILRVPVIAWLGFVSLILCIWIVYAGLTPAIAGTINPSYAMLTVSVFIIGLVVYGISAIYRSRSGLPLSLSFREVPPE